MRRLDLRPVAALAVVGLLAVIGVASCGQSDAVVARDAPAPPPFTAPPEGDGDGGPPGAPLMCVGTACPEGFDTCLSGPVGAAPHKCGTDLMRDDDNCGACGSKCPTYLPLHMKGRCVDGACELQCYSPLAVIEGSDWRDCNGKLADGCEADVLRDADHCGACGNACPSGVSCIRGKCGCAPGWIECSGECVDPKSDDWNCGECGHSCMFNPAPGQCETPPPNTVYGCYDGACGDLRCKDGWADCNGDLAALGCESDGCEARVGEDNCGACGNKCAEGELCLSDGATPYCGIPCVKDKKVLCGEKCVDLLNEVDACGACGVVCPSPGPHGRRTCNKGICGTECESGWADCNGDPADGCEVDLQGHPDHCGACGTRCDVTAGQPCIDGACLMVACTDPETK